MRVRERRLANGFNGWKSWAYLRELYKSDGLEFYPTLDTWAGRRWGYRGRWNCGWGVLWRRQKTV